MSFLPKDFVVPAVLETEHFRLRCLTIHDVVKDYDAVMSSQEHLWAQFGEDWDGWPRPTMTLEENLIDLAWHQKEFQLRSSFAYTVVRLDESEVLGCVYIDPAEIEGYEAKIHLWVRQSEVANGLDEVLCDTVKKWLAESWPFERVIYPGRE